MPLTVRGDSGKRLNDELNMSRDTQNCFHILQRTLRDGAKKTIICQQQDQGNSRYSWLKRCPESRRTTSDISLSEIVSHALPHIK